MIARHTTQRYSSAALTGRFVRSGLSLLEVVLALAIFMISLAAIATLIEAGTRDAAEASGTSDATRLAQSKLAEVEAGLIAISNGGSGTFDGDDAAWSWEVTSSSSAVPNTYDVSVRVFRSSGRKLEVNLYQTVFDPEFMNNAATTTPPETTGGSRP
jgi:general secretion pathway protein I